MNIPILPVEIIYEIVKYLPDKYRQKVRRCSKLFYDVVKDIGYNRIDIDSQEKLLSFIYATANGLKIRNSYLVLNFSSIDLVYLHYFRGCSENPREKIKKLH